MTDPVVVVIPHRLGKAEARRRVDAGIEKLAGWFPGGAAVDHRWEADVMAFTLTAMGQQVDSTLDVRESSVIATVNLPPFLALFAGKLREKLEREGPRLLD